MLKSEVAFPQADPGTSALLERVAEAAGAARRDGVWCFPPRHEPLEACVLQSLLHAVRVADQSSAAASPASQPTPTDDCIQSPSESGARKRARPAEEEEEGRGSRSHLDLGRARASMQTQEGAAAAASAGVLTRSRPRGVRVLHILCVCVF